MSFAGWYLLVGVLLVLMAVAGSLVRRLPLTTAMIYLVIGIALGPYGFGVAKLDPIRESAALERISEIAVIVSIFTAGLNLRVRLRDRRWLVPLRLAFGSMAITVGMVALAGVWLLGLPLGAAVLLGAILAPTDPVLATDVQVEHPFDPDRLRFALTGEAGLNDGTAFPFVMLGLGLLGLHDIGQNGWRWLTIDLVWAICAGLSIGWLLGRGVGSLVVYLRRNYRTAVGFDDFLAIGLIALAYGVAVLAKSYGFLAVFAAGLALRGIEMRESDSRSADDVLHITHSGREEDVATDPEKAPVYLTQSVLGFNEQMGRIGEIVVVVLLGAMLSPKYLHWHMLWFVPLLFLVIRPLATWLGLAGSEVSRQQKGLIAWFGIRGLGSIYYLMFAIEHGLTEETAHSLVSLTLMAVSVSIVVHGISVTPLMNAYNRRAAGHRG